MPKYVVRHGSMRSLGVFTTRGNEQFKRGQRVIARTQRGLEHGEVLCEAGDDTSKQMKDPGHGQILRAMTSQDSNELSHLHSNESAEFETCRKHVQRLQLDMELVDIEHVFGGERIVVYYLAEQRVDFRELVKSLASEFQTRIEMRQIGVRDEARLLADYGDCGKPVCCNTHLSAMPPVSMKMAKLQKATLDPTKISGRCGRLKCCLRYEYDTYAAIQKELPPIGSEVVTRNGKARVLNHEILSEQLLVATEDNRRALIDASEVLSVIRKERKPKENRPARDGKKPESGKRASGRDTHRAGQKQPEDAKKKSDQKQPETARRKSDEKQPAAAEQDQRASEQEQAAAEPQQPGSEQVQPATEQQPSDETGSSKQAD